MRDFIRRQIEEIAGDSALRIYGAVLSLGHGLGALCNFLETFALHLFIRRA